MEGFKVIVTTTLFLGVFLFNAVLYARSEGVRVYSRPTGDAWTKQCYYFTPLTIFIHTIDLAGECRVRMRIPGAPR